MAEDPRRRAAEILALRIGLDLGLTLIDTAEMYASGGAEELVGEAIAGRRDDIFLVSKVLPEHATRRGAIAACERSLQRLGTDRLDLYLLHWRGDLPLEATVEGFTALIRAGKIRRWGVSNLDVADMEELVRFPGGSEVATDQVPLQPGPSRHRMGSVAVVSPPTNSDHGQLADRAGPDAEAPGAQESSRQSRRDAGAGRTRLAAASGFDYRDSQGGKPGACTENRAALDIRLTDKDLAALDQTFPPPDGPRPLEML